MSIIKNSFTIAFAMLKSPEKTLEQLTSKKPLNALTFLLLVGAVTAFLTPLQIYLGFEDINGLHAGG